MKEVINPSVDWRSELNAAAFRFHVPIAWVAVFLNPVWVIGDYFNSPSHFTSFFIFRIVVSVITLVLLFFRNKLRNWPEMIVFIPFLGITLQNAYMYSVMNVVEFEKHTFAYIALFIGGGMFVIWRSVYSVIIVAVTIVSNIVMMALWSPLHINEILINGGLLTATVALFTILLIQMRTNLTKKEIIARLSLAESNKQLEEQKKIVEEKNKDIQDSITYAKRIQRAILPPDDLINTYLKNYFVLYRPKDIIAGDFYWFYHHPPIMQKGKMVEDIFIAAADCTGHGVPGALVSVVCSNALNGAVKEYALLDPGEILTKTRELVIETFDRSDKTIKDGMDISLLHLRFDSVSQKIMEANWSGANNPLWYWNNQDIIEITANKQPVGKADHLKPFTTHVLPVDDGVTFYLFTDGYADQFGGPEGKKFKYKPMRTLIESKVRATCEIQKETLHHTFEQWVKGYEQVDDVCIIGICI
jgi:serine phosphatase RsbU (regulator of sigma subunit)